MFFSSNKLQSSIISWLWHTTRTTNKKVSHKWKNEMRQIFFLFTYKTVWTLIKSFGNSLDTLNTLWWTTDNPHYIAAYWEMQQTPISARHYMCVWSAGCGWVRMQWGENGGGSGVGGGRGGGIEMLGLVFLTQLLSHFRGKFHITEAVSSGKK